MFHSISNCFEARWSQALAACLVLLGVLADPRRLLVEYNAAVAEGDYVFDEELADAVAGIGALSPESGLPRNYAT